MNKKAGTILALIVTAVHLFRFNLPEKLSNMYYFTLFGFMAWAIAFIALFFYSSNKFTKCVYLFNFFGVINASQNLIRGNPKPGFMPEGLMLLIAINLCVAYYNISLKKDSEPTANK